jgi:hypothetical protein
MVIGRRGGLGSRLVAPARRSNPIVDNILFACFYDNPFSSVGREVKQYHDYAINSRPFYLECSIATVDEYLFSLYVSFRIKVSSIGVIANMGIMCSGQGYQAGTTRIATSSTDHHSGA